MKPWARAFYLSKAWRRTRAYILKRDAGLCVRCGDIGEIVHHKTHLTPENITDPHLTLGEDNLETLCRVCHAVEHQGAPATVPGLVFDEFGNLIEQKSIVDLLS